MSTTATVGAHPTRRVVSNVIKGCLGNLIEWFDWFVYASFSIYFAKSFFPAESLTAQLLAAASIFAVGFLMRPLGGWILGMYADRFGRRNALAASVLLMSAGSLTIALTPGFDSIGVAAPILLLLARLLQGLSVGGEFGSSATYLSEIATPGRRGFYSSFQYVSIIMGQLAALSLMIGLQWLLTEDQMYSFGWRIPFVVGALAGLGVMFLRRGMDESEHFKNDQADRAKATAEGRAATQQIGIRALLKYPKQLAAVFGLALGGTVAFYVYTSYMQKYMVNTSGISKENAAMISFVALFIFMCLQPLVGWISDKYGRRAVMLFFSIGGTLVTVPVLTLLANTENVFAAFGLMMVGLVFVSGYTALSAIVKAEMFPTNVRALGVGLPHAIVAALFGGTAEPIALALKQAGSESMFFWYVTGCIAITFFAALTVKDPSKNSQLETIYTPSDESVDAPDADTETADARTSQMSLVP